MDALSLIAVATTVIYILLIIASFFWTIAKKILKIFSIITLVLFIASLALGYFVYRDVSDFQNRFAKEQSIFLLLDNNKFMTGFAQVGEKAAFFSNEQLKQFDDYHVANQPDRILGGSYKLFIVNSSYFNPEDDVDLSRMISVEGVTLKFKTSKLLEFLRTRDASFLVVKLNIDNDELAGRVFQLMLSNKLQSSQMEIITGLKKGNIIIYPETIVFKVLREFPDSIIEKASAVAKLR